MYFVSFFVLLVLGANLRHALASETLQVSAIGGDDAGERSLIIGGSEAAAGDYPYFAHFENPGCGGTLIAPDLVLTAGHVRWSS